MDEIKNKFADIGLSESLVISEHTYKIHTKLRDSSKYLYRVSDTENNNYVLKIFPYHDFLPDVHYLNESRFAFLSHKNVIKIKDNIKTHKTTSVEKGPLIFSLLISELGLSDLKRVLEGTKLKEKIARSIFYQLVEGLDYLHSKEVYHLDLKLNNIVIGTDYSIKIIDFDRAMKKGDLMKISCGTKNFRSPEISNSHIRCPKACDIYSLGIILFCLHTGLIPYCENEMTKGHMLHHLFLEDKPEYWKVFQSIFNKELDDSFKKLIDIMTCKDPSKRVSLKDVKKANWFLQSTYRTEIFVAKIKKILEKI